MQLKGRENDNKKVLIQSIIEGMLERKLEPSSREGQGEGSGVKRANTSVDSGSAAKRSRPEEGMEGGGTVAGASTFTSAETEQSNLSQAHEVSNELVQL